MDAAMLQHSLPLDQEPDNAAWISSDEFRMCVQGNRQARLYKQATAEQQD